MPASRQAGSRSRPAVSHPHFTGRAAVLAIVLCGIALSLAYPVREYISQRKQIDQLLAQQAAIMAHKGRLEAEHKLLHSPAYVAQQARDRLHMCLPTQTCYEIIGRSRKPRGASSKAVASPWYARVWASVRQADAPRPHPHAKPGGRVRQSRQQGRQRPARTGKAHDG
ncbi:MAG TPA: septum formation initiator family protein [Streptosporangiaceae bacterium]|nr:septum formation initiator family protein [Streptosporangiaceae bacterium]